MASRADGTGLVSALPEGATPALTEARDRPRSITGAVRKVSIRRRIFADRLATVLVTAGGISIIASILAILIFIVGEVVPLIWPARVETAAEIPLAGGRARALLVDPYRTHTAALDEDGMARVYRLADGEVATERRVLPEGTRLVAAKAALHDGVLSASTDRGQVVLVPVDWEIEFVGDQRKVNPVLEEPRRIDIDPSGAPLQAYEARVSSDGALVVAQLADGSVATVRLTKQENLFTGESTDQEERATAPAVEKLTQLVLDSNGQNLFGASADGDLLWWRVAGGTLSPPESVAAGAPVSALSLLVGGRSLIVGQEDGALSVWFVVPAAANSARLTRIRDFPPFASAVELIAPSQRDKGFLASSREGELGLFYSTSNRVLWTAPSPVGNPSALVYSPKADGAYVAGGGKLAILDVSNPHPEVSFATLFSRIWYEGYPEPAYVWQSSSATNDAEAKLSLTPLLVGTLKGTFYSLLLAIPLGVFGAMYLAHFMSPGLKRYVKPTIEIMAALPSVVLGFLAGLWLAPRLEKLFPAMLLILIVFPVLTLSVGAVWERVPARIRNRIPVGSEAFALVLVLGAGLWFSVWASPLLEAWLFGGNFQAWLLSATGLPYDQRNAIVVGIAMGFAVIPIILTISEDAFTNVPSSLVSASLALGANRWQTVTKVVLPTASPGIFSAIMVGFGRAVGETMIVLMATGNTPILDWNPFNGFRTLSANIAVEIPEAPQFGTLYRILFLAALLLFLLTFAVNTVAELVRQRLRRRYAQL